MTDTSPVRSDWPTIRIPPDVPTITITSRPGVAETFADNYEGLDPLHCGPIATAGMIARLRALADQLERSMK